MSYSQHIKDQMPRKYEFNISIDVLHISGLLIYLELKIKSSFQELSKTHDSTMIFGYIFTIRIQPFEATNISAAFFFRQATKNNMEWNVKERQRN